MLLDFSSFLRPAVAPALITIAVIASVTLLLALLSRRGYRPPLWTDLLSKPSRVIAFAMLAILAVGGLSIAANAFGAKRVEEAQRDLFSTERNLACIPSFIHVSLSETASLNTQLSVAHTPAKFDEAIFIGSQMKLVSPVISVRPGERLRYSLYTDISGEGWRGETQVRVLWFNRAISVTSHLDSPVWETFGDTYRAPPPEFHTAVILAPPEAAFMSLEIRDVSPRHENVPSSNSTVGVYGITLTRQGVHVEPHPSAARASIAFSFDWESAMGGLIHSKGGRDLQAAALRGLDMREGAEWLKGIFEKHKIEATFYSTGYNLLDGNKEKRTFVGDPTYDWARPKNGWSDEYWASHRWYSDDPYADYSTHPQWYFGDLTLLLQNAGHEIGPHTFGHLYVRGSNPEELAADTDEWLRLAKERGLPQPTTFAFPWRSSNSLTADFYDVLYQRGVRAVTRIYERDLRDLYTLYAVPPYPGMYVMPDFLLGAQEGDAIENEGGDVIDSDEGLAVIKEAIARRGTTSFWTHPEELAPDSSLDGNRKAWESVVSEAARQRDAGTLWIAPVADIVAYQSDVSKVSASLERGILGLGGWKVVVHNDSGKELEGVTLTLPGAVTSASNPDVATRIVPEPNPDGFTIDFPPSPGHQIVLSRLKPGTIKLDITWAHGEEPLE